jgi:DNA-directed RNA polymerase subunit RPC12/RpoP
MAGEVKITRIRCPNCDSRRVTKFLYGLQNFRRAYLCRACKKFYYMKVEEIVPFICSKCDGEIVCDSSKYTVMANNTTKHNRCPRRKK